MAKKNKIIIIIKLHRFNYKKKYIYKAKSHAECYILQYIPAYYSMFLLDTTVCLFIKMYVQTKIYPIVAE